MPVCARAVAQPDGSLLLALDPAVTDTSTCAYVVETGGETGWLQLSNLDIPGAEVIAAYIAGVWAIAFGFKAVRQFLLTLPESDSNE